MFHLTLGLAPTQKYIDQKQYRLMWVIILSSCRSDMDCSTGWSTHWMVPPSSAPWWGQTSVGPAGSLRAETQCTPLPSPLSFSGRSAAGCGIPP